MSMPPSYYEQLVEISGLKRALAAARAELTNVQRNLQETHDQRNELQAELNAARARIDELEDE